MKKIGRGVIASAVVLLIWSAIRAIWHSTVLFADIFGDTGGENMALLIGILWLLVPAVSYIWIMRPQLVTFARYGAFILLCVPFFLMASMTLKLPLHQLGVDAGQGRMAAWIFPGQLFLVLAGMLPYIVFIRLPEDKPDGSCSPAT